MNTQMKRDIQTKLNAFLESFDKPQQAVNVLKDVSYATIISMRDGKWDNISPEMWRNVGVQVGWHPTNKQELQIVHTRDFETMVYYFNLAKQEGQFFSIIGNKGTGKTTAGKWYAKNMKTKSVYWLLCAEYWTQRQFLEEIVKVMGKKCEGTAYELMEFIVAEVRKKPTPLFIFDEVDKLSDKCLRFFITLENHLNGMCGFVWTSTRNIKVRMDRGIRYGKLGYEELSSRIGKVHIELKGTTKAEVVKICESRGLMDVEDKNEILNTYEGDLRRVDRLVLRNKVSKAINDQQ